MVFVTTVKGLMSIPCQYCFLAVVLALAGSGRAAADEAAKPPVFAVRTARGRPVEGAWRQLKADWSVRVGEGDGTLVSGDNVLTVRRVGVPLPPLPVADHLILTNGDR